MTTKYQRQWTEFEAIKSIYEKEFEELKFPWKVDHPPWFRINLNVGLSIEIRMTKIYPDGVPEIKVQTVGESAENNISKEHVEELNSKLKKEAEGLVGGEMCFDLIEIAREFAQSLQKRGKTSFHTEMLLRQEERDRQALDLQAAKQLKSEEALQKRKKVEMEELEKKITEELKEKLVIKDELVTRRDHSSSADYFEFEPPIVVDDLEVKSVKCTSNTKAPMCTFGKSLRVVSCDYNTEFDLKIIPLSHPFLQTFGGRRQLEHLLKNLRSHPNGKCDNVLRCFGGQIDKEAGEMHLLYEITADNVTSIHGVLEQAGCLAFNRVVEYLKQICVGLSNIHAIGLTHRCLDLESVLIDGIRAVKISDYLVRRCLNDLAKEHGITFDNTFEYKEQLWPAPEIASRPNIHGKKVDIWCLGRIAIQMLFGAESLNCWPGGFEDFKRSLECERLPVEMKDFLRNCLDRESEKRMTAEELLRECKLFEDNRQFSITVDHTVVVPIKPKITVPVESTVTPSSSRYLTDFEELEFLGRGGFGSVVKVRNKIDDRFYAVKKIALDPRDVEYNKKILREVTTLSRLHHERIIRYYQAWIEDGEVAIDDEEDGYEDDTGTAETETETFTPLDLSLGPKSFKPFSGLESEEFDDDSSDDEGDFDDFIQFARDTGDKEDISDTMDNRPTSPSSLASSSYNIRNKTKSQVLYIQMEYCPNQTLRDLIDERNLDVSGHFLDAPEIWRLFRQIVEGLVHIHAQGMMHRDLKPSNIFLDSNGDVKIGDFGLAVTRIESSGGNTLRADSPLLLQLTKKQAHNEKSFTGESHTQNIGTPFYVSPEQITSSISSSNAVRYNQKVDMYSLGIILIELWIPFKTGMERVQCLQRCRLPEVYLPEKLLEESVVEIGRRLLCHDPKKRFASLELLRSDLLPPMLEEELMEDAMRSVAQPGAPHFPRLVSTIFRRLNDLDAGQLRVKDFAFDVHSGNATELGTVEDIWKIKRELERVFLRYGAVEINPPLLYIPLGTSNSHAYNVLDDSGQRLELPGNLTRPFARWVAQSSLQLGGDLKRFAVDRVFRKISQVSGGQPFQPFEANFDLVHVQNERSLLAVCEVVRVMFDSVLPFVKAENLVFKFNHLKLRERITSKFVDVPVNFAGPSILRVPSGVFDEKMTKILGAKDFDGLISGLGAVCADLKSGILRDLYDLNNFLVKLAIPSGKVKIICDPLLEGPRSDIYANDFCFVLLREGSDRKGKQRSDHCDLLGCGGRYNQLVEEYKFPTARLEGKGPFAVGMSLFLDKLAGSGGPLPCKPKRSFVINLGSEEPNGDELILIGEMWRLGRAGQLTINRAGVNINNNTSVQLQMKSSNNRIVRIKRGRDVEEVSIEDFASKLRSIDDSNTVLSGDSGDETVSNVLNEDEALTGDVHYLLVNSKMEKNPILREKALRAVKQVVNLVKCDIVIHELPKEVLKRTLHPSADSGNVNVNNKRLEEWRELVGRLSNLLLGKLAGKMILFVNHKDSHIEAYFNKQ